MAIPVTKQVSVSLKTAVCCHYFICKTLKRSFDLAYPPSSAAMNGDCYSDSECSETPDYALRRPWSWCEDNGYSYFELYYNGKACLSKDEGMLLHIQNWQCRM